MIAAGLVEVWLGVDAEQRPLEDIATPLTAEDADQHLHGHRAPRAPGLRRTVQRRQRAAVRAGRHPAGELPALVADVSRLRRPLIDTVRDREVSQITSAMADAGPSNGGS